MIGLSELEAAFEIMVDSFVFVDKNKDGHVSKDELVEAMREGSSGQSSSDFIALERFGQFFSLSICNSQFYINIL